MSNVRYNYESTVPDILLIWRIKFDDGVLYTLKSIQFSLGCISCTPCLHISRIVSPQQMGFWNAGEITEENFRTSLFDRESLNLEGAGFSVSVFGTENPASILPLVIHLMTWCNVRSCVRVCSFFRCQKDIWSFMHINVAVRLDVMTKFRLSVIPHVMIDALLYVYCVTCLVITQLFAVLYPAF